jgi:hypothetical protein
METFSNNEQSAQSEQRQSELLASAAATVIAASSSEFDSVGGKYSSNEEVEAAIEALRSRGEWPEPDEGKPQIGRALMNRRRFALWGEGIVTRPFWL